MINKPPPFKGLTIRILIIIPIKGTGFINQGSGLGSGGAYAFLGLHGLRQRLRPMNPVRNPQPQTLPKPQKYVN